MAASREVNCSCEAWTAATVAAVWTLLEEISNCEFIWLLSSQSELQAGGCTLWSWNRVNLRKLEREKKLIFIFALETSTSTCFKKRKSLTQLTDWWMLSQSQKIHFVHSFVFPRWNKVSKLAASHRGVTLNKLKTHFASAAGVRR